MFRLFKYTCRSVIITGSKVGITSTKFASQLMKKSCCLTVKRCFKLCDNCKCVQGIPKSFAKCVQSQNIFKETVSLHVRHFHTSNPNSGPPPLLVVALRPLINIAVILFGRTLRKWWRSLSPERKAVLISKLKQYQFRITGGLTLLTVSLVHGYFSHLERNPITNRWRFILFTHDQMKQVADLELEVLSEQFQGNFLHASDDRFRVVVNIASRILTANQDEPGVKETKWKVTVVDHPLHENAFVLPNGAIFIFTKMIELCDNEDQLGIIIAHEISHSLLQHLAEQLSNVQMIEWLLMIPLVIVWALVPDILALLYQWFSGQLTKLTVHLPFSRFIEMEADQVGLQLAAKACFDVREAPMFWKKLANMHKTNGKVNIEWLSTHPNHETREQSLDDMVPLMLQLRTKCNCPPLKDYCGIKKRRK